MGEINLPIDQKIKYLYSTINIRKVIEKKKKVHDYGMRDRTTNTIKEKCLGI